MARPPLERLPFFRLYSADYLIDTAGLSQREHGAYLLLLIYYYWRGFLPVEKPELYTLARAIEPDEKTAVDTVISRYFSRENGALIHHRVEREIAQRITLLHTRSEAGRRSGEVRAQRAAVAAPIAAPIAAPKVPRAKPKGNGEDKPASDSIAAFWAAYPRHEAKAAAVKAWAKLAPDQALQGRILQAVAAQKSSEQWQRGGGKFIPHAATWLNAKRWEDEAPPAQEERFPI